ncbi:MULTISPECIES: aminodeoxychorismate lyase [Bacillus]|uniref:aminodeoxychorismate lyase n=1 Tax=Bacillus TaxID=1386 RepID=UPI0005D31266|nr:aminodeoxychorismate lyase [Bacillus altitudinis]KQL41718.1 4-amino-4-deoxychorismate lyase [Bacillus sp. FJAT-21955]KJF46192.1 4-amino-4-deoxychorismate lyase [Bacillus altitudinis]MBU8654883.1 aminodeoxychorismate lyase [Bacillus altitudinis]MBU8780400.1 aminodeoxychorismate lyase [Bacillus altitudinis]NMF16486.1 aminodeoxychorismate lyase [Bacillus altitudinis]
MIIYLNGQYIEEKDATLSPFDHGFLYGIGVFETFTSLAGQVFLLDWHLERLNQSLRDLCIESTIEKPFVLDIIYTLLNKNQIAGGHARIRLNVSAGRGNGFSADPYEEPVVFVMISPFRPESILDEKKGVILQTRRNTPEGPRRLKSHHYMNNLLAKREMGNDPALEGIFLTKEDEVAEGITSNVFWRKDDVVYTPSLDTGILNGVTRRYCIETLHAMGVSLKEGRYPVSHLLSADEVWMTNSVQGVVPFGSIGDIHLPKNSRTISTKLRMQYTKERQDHKE